MPGWEGFSQPLPSVGVWRRGDLSVCVCGGGSVFECVGFVCVCFGDLCVTSFDVCVCVTRLYRCVECFRYGGGGEIFSPGLFGPYCRFGHPIRDGKL